MHYNSLFARGFSLRMYIKFHCKVAILFIQVNRNQLFDIRARNIIHINTKMFTQHEISLLLHAARKAIASMVEVNMTQANKSVVVITCTKLRLKLCKCAKYIGHTGSTKTNLLSNSIQWHTYTINHTLLVPSFALRALQKTS